jgi:hypothetical protein
MSATDQVTIGVVLGSSRSVRLGLTIRHAAARFLRRS